MEPEILAEEVKLFIAGKVEVFKMAARLKSYREMLLMCYKYEVNTGLIKLEDLEADYKQEIWGITKEYTEGMNKEGCIEMSKIVYLILSKI